MIRCGWLLAGILMICKIAAAQIPFEKVYGGTLPEVFRSVIETSDGNLLAAGSTRSYGLGTISTPVFYLVKTTADGDTMWTHSYDSILEGTSIAVREWSDGYVIGGTSFNPLNNTLDIHAIKTDYNGNVLWNFYYGGTGSDYCTDLIPLPGKELLICGTTTSFTNGGFDFYILKIDSNGTAMNAAHYGGTGNEAAYGIRSTIDGGYIISGLSSSGLTSTDMYLVKADSALNFQWSQTFGGSGFDIGYDVEQDDGGNYFLLGSWANGPDSSEIALIKTDTAGLNAVVKYPGLHQGDNGYKLKKVNDGLLIAGNTFVPGKESEALLIKTDFDGDTLWSRHYGGTKNEVAFSVFPLSNGDIAIAGETEGFGVDNFDGYLVRVNTNGDVPCPDAVSFVASDSSLCEDETVIFTNTTVSSQQFNWELDGNSFSNDINAAYYFNEGGNNTISLSACTASSSETINVFAKPPAHFTYFFLGQTATFFLPASLTPSSWSWNFGDGSQLDSINLNPSHFYANEGSYWVIFSCADSNGCDSVYTEQIHLITGIDDPGENEFSFFVTPDPIHDAGEIVISKNTVFPLNATIYDLAGRKRKQFLVAGVKQNFSVGGLEPGVYFLELSQGDPLQTEVGGNRWFKRLIIQ